MPHLEPIAALSDNYIWLIRTAAGEDAAVVDPGQADPVLEVLADHGLRLAAILLTHHHGDHVGGVAELSRQAAVPVYGPAVESIPTVDHPVAEGDSLALPALDLKLDVMAVPGHTLGHVAYTSPDFALVGDTLFAGGCGRVFEGTLDQMYESLGKLAVLPGDTLAYCAHEYTLANLRFGLEVEPGNSALQRRFEAATAIRSKNLSTVPSRIAEELETNVFLRCEIPEVRAAAEAHAGRALATAAEVFAVIRSWKDGWRG